MKLFNSFKNSEVTLFLFLSLSFFFFLFLLLSSFAKCIIDTAQPSSTTASKALDYVVFLVDVDRLYDVALGLYDFDLVLMVAQKSQKDPKEYLPFLANLQTMDTHTQRYVIDSHLGRWDSALQNLAASGGDKMEQVIALMNKHSLYQTALRVSYLFLPVPTTTR